MLSPASCLISHFCLIYRTTAFDQDVFILNATLFPHAQMLQCNHGIISLRNLSPLFHNTMKRFSLDNLALHRSLHVLPEEVSVVLKNSGRILVQWIRGVWFEEEELSY